MWLSIRQEECCRANQPDSCQLQSNSNCFILCLPSEGCDTFLIHSSCHCWQWTLLSSNSDKTGRMRSMHQQFIAVCITWTSSYKRKRGKSCDKCAWCKIFVNLPLKKCETGVYCKIEDVENGHLHSLPDLASLNIATVQKLRHWGLGEPFCSFSRTLLSSHRRSCHRRFKIGQ